jgi:hypothetical protein
VILDGRTGKGLTATNVPGKKIIPRREIVFIPELSRLLSIAIVLIAALSSLLALAMIADVSAMLILALAFLAAM